MKRWSAKTKLTLLYAAFMILLTCAALAILFSLSNQEILSSVQSKLREQVEEVWRISKEVREILK